MADLPKRVWSGKKQVYSGKKPVWVKDGKLGVYDPNFEEVTSGQYYSPNRWGNLSADAELQIYDDKDSLNGTDIGTFEDGLSATYQFIDWDGTVLKSGTVKDGETPTAPTNPSRTGYTFTGWNPTVGPVNKNTTFSAVYRINSFNVNFTNDGNGSTNYSSINRDYGSSITISGNTITIADVTVTATASQGYEFDTWVNADGGDIPATLTDTLNIRATFKTAGYTITFEVSEETYSEGGGTISTQSIQVPVGTTVESNDPENEWHGATLTFKNGGQTIATVNAIPNTGYMFERWWNFGNEEGFTITEDLTFVGAFITSVTLTFVANPSGGGTVSEQSITVPQRSSVQPITVQDNVLYIERGCYTYFNVTATAGQGYTFNNWTINGTPLVSETIYEDTTITANFQAQAQTYSINATADSRDNYGDIKSSSVYDGGDPTTGIPYGTTWSASGYSIVFSNGLTLTPNPGYDSGLYCEFEGWYTSWDKNTSTGTVLPETGTVTGNMNIICVFGGIYEIGIYPEYAGSVDKSSVNVPFGTVVSLSNNTITFEKNSSTIETVIVTPDTDYHVAYTTPDILNSYKTVGNGGITSYINISFSSDVSY